MSNGATYTVTHLKGCRLVFGPVPMTEMASLLSSSQNDDVMDVHIASLVGATMVTGSREALDELLASDDLPISEDRIRDRDAAIAAGLPEAFVEWLYRGQRGVSSDYIAHRVTGIPAKARQGFPHDSADFKRCLDVIASLKGAKPESDVMDVMASDCDQWKNLSLNWDILKDMAGKSSLQCSSFMRKVLSGENSNA